MEQLYIQRGDKFMVEDKNAFIVLDQLPTGTYSVNHDIAKGYYLIKVENLKTEGKIYGNLNERAARILNTYMVRDKATGVLLVGDKGSGKTMLTRRVSETAQDMIPGCVTILVNNKFYGEDFNVFLQSITQPAVVLFDEFEKTYTLEEQEHLLTVFDGVQSSKKLYLLTCNNEYRVNEFMLNRPGRIYYKFKYKGLDKAFITDYCNDNLDDKNEIKNVIAVSRFFSNFSFDMLKALVEETNRYKESAIAAATVLNLDPEADYSVEHILHVYRNGIRMHNEQGPIEFRVRTSPLKIDGESWYISVNDNAPPSDSKFENDVDITLNTSLLDGVDTDGYAFIFKDPILKDVKLAFKRKEILPITASYGMLA